MLILTNVYSNKYKTEHQIYIYFDPRLTYEDRLWMVRQMEILVDALISIDVSDKELFEKGYTKKELIETITLN